MISPYALVTVLSGWVVDMRKFREFPYRGSLLRFQSGAVQEVFHEPISAKVLLRLTISCLLVSHLDTNILLFARGLEGVCKQSSAHAWVDQVLVERMELVCHMVDEAARLVPERIQFKWSHACTVIHPVCGRKPCSAHLRLVRCCRIALDSCRTGNLAARSP